MEKALSISSAVFLCTGLTAVMRLLLSAYACRPNAGSEPGYGWNWASYLAARGIDVHALVAERNREAVESSAAPQGVQFHFVGVPAWAKRSETLQYACWQARALQCAKKLHARLCFDIAHHVTYGSVHVPTQLWRLGIPVIFGPVGGGQTAPREMSEYFGKHQWKERHRTFLTKALTASPLHRRAMKQFSLVLAANRDTLRLVEALGCRRVALMCDAGISPDYISAGPRNFREPSDGLKLIWAGRMLPRKALPLALDALKNVRSNVTLTIAGDGMDPEAVRSMIHQRNLENRVFWKGVRLSLDELRAAYAEHDAMLFTSLRDSFGSQMLEAMAMGLPVIALDLHGARDFLPSNAWSRASVGKPQETVRNLASAIEEYGSLPSDRRNEMSRNAWNFAKTMTWQARAEAVEEIYKQVLSPVATPESAAEIRMTAAV